MRCADSCVCVCLYDWKFSKLDRRSHLLLTHSPFRISVRFLENVIFATYVHDAIFQIEFPFVARSRDLLDSKWTKEDEKWKINFNWIDIHSGAVQITLSYWHTTTFSVSNKSFWFSSSETSSSLHSGSSSAPMPSSSSSSFSCYKCKKVLKKWWIKI